MKNKALSLIALIMCFCAMFIFGCAVTTTSAFPFVSLTWEFNKDTGTITKYNGFNSNVNVP